MATNGPENRGRNFITSLYIVPEDLEQINIQIQAKYAEACKHEVRYQEFDTDDADLVLVAYGSTARICRTTMNMARKKGLKVGLFRPISLFPFPIQPLADLARAGKRFLTVEMSAGQMVEDVRLSVNGVTPVDFYGRLGGIIPSPVEVLGQVEQVLLKPFLPGADIDGGGNGAKGGAVRTESEGSHAKSI